MDKSETMPAERGRGRPKSTNPRVHQLRILLTSAEADRIRARYGLRPAPAARAKLLAR